MRIDSYSFGVMKIQGTNYKADVIILGDKIISNWWRRNGHNLAAEDLGDVIDYKPQVLVVGRGAYGMMDVPASTKERLQTEGIELIAEETGKACDIFNKQTESGRKTAGAFHLTC